jgi:hypothetical protein
LQRVTGQDDAFVEYAAPNPVRRPGLAVMDHYRDTAFYLLATIVAVPLIVLNDVGLLSAFLIAANLALLFAFVLMAWAAA